MLIEARDWQSDTVREIRIDVSPGNKVSTVKKTIEATEVIAANLQRLSYGGRLLQDEQTLGAYQIDNTSTLQMWWCKCMACRATSAELAFDAMRVYVETPEAKTLALTVSGNATVYSVKAQAWKEAGLAPGRQRLLFNEDELQNGKTLHEYNIGKESCLQMVATEPWGLMSISVCIAILDLTISLEVRKTDTVKDVKAMIQQNEGIPTYHQRLKPRYNYGFFNREMNNADLQDELTLTDLNINRGDSFFLMRRSKHPAACPCFECCGSSFHFFVKTVTGKSILVDLKSFHTVEMIKKKVHDKEGISISKQRLVFEEKELEDDKTLFDYNIEVDSIVKLLVTPSSSKHHGIGHLFSKLTTAHN